MSESALYRLLELVRRELEADDARVELGGREPDPTRAIWASLGQDWRLVALFDEMPADCEPLEHRLQALAASFSELRPVFRSEPPPPDASVTSRRLDEHLRDLVMSIGACCAFVVDLKSPVIWGTSESRRAELDSDALKRLAASLDVVARAGKDILEVVKRPAHDLATWLEKADIDPLLARSTEREISAHLAGLSPAAARATVVTAHAMGLLHNAVDESPSAAQRDTLRDDSISAIVRRCANIYYLVVAFDRPFSELHAEAGVLRALPMIERLVLSLPPIDPNSGGRVIELRVEKPKG